MKWNSSSSQLPGKLASLRWFLSLVLFGLVPCAGCHIPALCCPEASPYLPGDFVGVTEVNNSANVGIDQFFGDPILTHLIAEGMDSNQELRIRNQEIRIASNEIQARQGAFLPFVTLGLFGDYDKASRFTPLGAAEDQLELPGGGEFPDPLGNARVSADLTWSIDIWHELRNQRDAAKQRYVRAVEERNYMITEMVAEIAENYYELTALDQRLRYLNQTIEFQNESLEVAQAMKQGALGTELPVQRFMAEVRKNESERAIIQQQMIEVENNINLLVGRYPQAVVRTPWDAIQLDSSMLSVGIPAQLLMNRSDIRAAERELAAAGLDVKAARARFYPRLDLTAGVGFEAFNPSFMFDPEAFVFGVGGELVAPLINKKAIRAEYQNANARQLQAVYDYQLTVLEAFISVVNRLAEVRNYGQSVVYKRQQVEALEKSVEVASTLFQNAEEDYVEVLLAQRELLEARIELLETKKQQLTATVQAYQALGGGLLESSFDTELIEVLPLPPPLPVIEDLPMPEPE